MDLSTKQRKSLIWFVVIVFATWLIVGMMAFYNNKDAELATAIKAGNINACYIGCYNAIELILLENETVTGAFPIVYNACQFKCDRQHG